MLYGMKTANLAYVTKTRVRFFKLDRWANVSDLSTDHKSLLAKIFHDRCVGVWVGGAVWLRECWGEAPTLKEQGEDGEGANWSRVGVCCPAPLLLGQPPQPKTFPRATSKQDPLAPVPP